MRKIIHSDCDCFYAAVEMRDNPELRGIPLAVGGASDRRGVIATCNYEARHYGVRSAMSTARALQLCPTLTLVSGRMEAYKETSRQIMAIYQDYTDQIEPLSLDEAFLDVTESEACRGSATLIAEEIRRRVREEVGVTVSIGVAPSKFLAKIASDWNKPDGLCVILPEQVDQFVSELKIEKLHGVGSKTAEKLHQLQIYTCADLRRQPLDFLLRHFGRFGQRLSQLAWGVDERPVKTSRVRKTISTEHTYARDLPGLDDCLVHLDQLLGDLQQRYAKLRGYRIRGVLVKMKFHDFTQTTVESGCQQPTRELYLALMVQAWRRGERPVRLLGVGYRLEPDGECSLALQQMVLF